MAQTKYADVLTKNAIKKELTFNISNFNKPEEHKGLHTLAFNIRNLMLMKKGTMPNSPRMGIDILSYRFDRLTNDNLIKIQDEILNQIETYMGRRIVANVVIKREISTNKINNGVYILFVLTPDTKAKTDIENLVIKLANIKDKMVFERIEYS